MAGSGRKPAVKIAIGAAAVGVTTSLVGVAATQPASISAPLVDLAALIVVGSSTHPGGEGVEDFFGGKFRDPMYTGPNGDDIIHVNFWDGPAGIQAALDSTDDGEKNAIIASGWGAANVSLLLLRENPKLRDNTVLILDNDVARPDGGFGTRYPLFALIGVNPFPTPSDTGGVPVVNTGYEYDYNSNAPGYWWNPFSAVNALAAYLTTRLNQAEIDLPVDAEGRPIAPDGSPLTCGGANTCAITETRNVIACPDARCSSPGDRITAYVTTRNDTTYVTYTTRELPLTTLIRGIFGDYIANVTAPLLKWAVDIGYYGGNPIPSDPSAYRPGRIFPSIGDVVTALIRLPIAILETVAAVFAPFFPRQAAPPQTVTTQQVPEERQEQESGQGTEDLTQTLSTDEESEEQAPEGRRTQELTTEGSSEELSTEQPGSDELTTQELSTEEQPKAEDQKTEHTTDPLMNVVRNSLIAVPGQPIVAPADEDNSTTDAQPTESEQNPEPQQPTGPATIGGSTPDTNPNPGDGGDDSADNGTDAAA
jgi:hypothetical protein